MRRCLTDEIAPESARFCERSDVREGKWVVGRATHEEGHVCFCIEQDGITYESTDLALI